MLRLFDSHCHLQFPQYDADRGAVLARMQERGVGAVVVGTDYETSRAGVALARQHDFLWASVGLHPNDNKEEQFDISNYEMLAADPKVVAIGECGLDYYRSSGEGQRERFEAHIQLAIKLNKTLIVHCRPSVAEAMEGKDAHDDMLNILSAYSHELENKVIMHFFTGTAQLAQKYLDLGCYLSFPGPVTYTHEYDASIEAAPLDKILIETDAPFAAPVPHRGKRNEPAYVEHVAAKVAALKGISIEELSRQIILNSQRVFAIDF